MPHYQKIQLDAHTWIIQEEQVRCFLFEGSQKALLVDSGMELTDLRSTVSSLTSCPIILANTHTDHDHISCNDQFEEVWMHPAEFSFYHRSSGRTQGLCSLWEGDVIDLGGRHFQVIHTPGHTPGSIALLDEENRILIGGDGIQDGTIYMYGPQRDLNAYICSLERLQARYVHSFDLVYPSHSSRSVPASIIQPLMEAAKRLLDGQIPGLLSPEHGSGVALYDLSVAKMLYQP